MKKSIRKIIAVFLVLIYVMPISSAFAANDSRLISVSAVGLYDKKSRTVELLEYGDRYYISQKEAASLAGLENADFDGQAKYTAYHFTLTPDVGSVESVEFDGAVYYSLEQIMNEFQTYIIDSDDGILHYNSVPANIDLLLNECDRIFETSYYRNTLEGTVAGDLGYALTVTYDTLANLRFNALWGEAYREDISKLMVKIIQPDNTENIIACMNNANETAGNVSDVLLAGQEGYESLKEFLYDIPKGSDYLLFDIEGTGKLRELLEANSAVSELDVLDIILEQELGKETFESYKDIADKAGTFKNIEMLSLGDLFKAAEYIADIVQIETAYADSLAQVLDYGDVSAEGGFFNQAERYFVRDCAEDVLYDYKLYVEQNLPGALADATAATLETAAGNATQSVLTELLYGKGAILVNAESWLLDKIMPGLDEGVDTVRTEYMCADIQSLFKDCYYNCLENGAEADEMQLIKSSVLLYLKTHMVALNERANSESEPVQHNISLIEKDMQLIHGFDERMFNVADNETVFSAGAFAPLNDVEELSSGAEKVNIIVPDGGEVYADVDFDGIDDLVKYRDNEMQEGLYQIDFSSTGESWTYTYPGDDFFRNGYRELYKKMQLMVFEYEQQHYAYIFAVDAPGNGGSEEALLYDVFCRVDGEMIRQGYNDILYKCYGSFSSDGTELHLGCEDTGYSENVAVDIPAEMVNVDEPVWPDYDVSISCMADGFGNKYFCVGTYMSNGGRSDRIGTSYALVRINGSGIMEIKKQWFEYYLSEWEMEFYGDTYIGHSPTDITVSDIIASSTLVESSVTHSSDRIFDEDVATAWVEGAPGQGVGESVAFEFDDAYNITGVAINSGYQKSEEAYEKNSRPKSLIFTFSDGSGELHELENVNDIQYVFFNRARMTDSLILTITAVYPGTAYEDTVISEILFLTE